MRSVHNAGLGLRRAHLSPLSHAIPATLDFLEVAPENWLGVGGRLRDAFEAIAARTTLVCHGLQLNLGGTAPLDDSFLAQLRPWLDDHEVAFYGDHLTFCADHGHLYELLPMPFTAAAVAHLADRVKHVQDVLGRRITVENASYYCLPGASQMSELEFVCSVLDAADCWLLLDVNNVYVNSENHGYSAREFLRQIPGDRIAYAHIAGHTRLESQLIIDTHGAPVIDPVWQLLDFAYGRCGVFPTLLERDEDVPALEEVLAEVDMIRTIQARHAPPARAAAG